MEDAAELSTAAFGAIVASDVREWSETKYSDAIWVSRWKFSKDTSLAHHQAALEHIVDNFRNHGQLVAELDLKKYPSVWASILALAWSLAFQVPNYGSAALSSQSSPMNETKIADLFDVAVLKPLRSVSTTKKTNVIVVSGFDHESGFTALSGLTPLLAKFPFGFKFAFVGTNDRLPAILAQFRLHRYDITQAATALASITITLGTQTQQDLRLPVPTSVKDSLGVRVARDCSNWIESPYADASWIRYWRFDRATTRAGQSVVLPAVLRELRSAARLAGVLDFKRGGGADGSGGAQAAVNALAWGLALRVPAYRRALVAGNLNLHAGPERLFEGAVLAPLRAAGRAVPKPFAVVVHNFDSEAGFDGVEKFVPLLSQLPYGFKFAFSGSNERLPPLLEQFKVVKYDLLEASRLAREQAV
ncbi:hypothetical protein BC830DRAFT_1167699 [Chytriomyces sp. MP71]|nr:hypothetical protein BC830DRAFT_1167699 [Chytriomyces sp. MP71]